MLAMRSFTTLMARRATGVSANLRRFVGVGLGVRFGLPWPWFSGLRIDGSIAVLRAPRVASPESALSSFRPASLCHASVTCVRRPTCSPLSKLFVAIKMAQPIRCALLAKKYLPPIYTDRTDHAQEQGWIETRTSSLICSYRL